MANIEENIRKLWKKRPIIVVIGLIIILFGVYTLIQPPGLTLISVSSVTIDPQGYEDTTTKEWRGSFWTALMLTDCTDQIVGIKFSKDSQGTYMQSGTGVKVYASDTISGNKLVPESTIVIKIDPQQPYWERPLEIKSVTVTPKTYGTYKPKLFGEIYKDTSQWVDAVYSGHYEWGTGYWTAHTPFIVTVFRNTVLIGQKTIDTVGTTSTTRIPDSGIEYITISDLGKLGTGYGEPQLGDIMYFSADNIFKLDTNSKNLVEYDGGGVLRETAFSYIKWVDVTNAYSNYWFYHSRWADDKSPVSAEVTSSISLNLLDSSRYGGWEDNDDTWNYKRKAIAPKVLERADPNFMSLVEYLSYKGVQKIDPYVWKQAKSPEIITESATGSKKLRVYLPFGSMNSLITVKISTELADTIVWQPQVANIKITSFPDLGDIGDRKTGTIAVKQESTVASSGTVSLTVSPTTAPLSINPSTQGTGTMNPGDTKTLTYEILNLGGNEKVPFTITATVTNSLGSTTSTDTATGTLLPKGAGETVLTVYTMDDVTKEKVSGIQITAVFDSQSKGGITSDGAVTWNLGSAQPSVTVTSAETPTYQSKTVTQQMVAGPNTVYLWLVKQGVTPPFDWTLILIAVALVALFIVVFSIMYKKRRKLFG